MTPSNQNPNSCLLSLEQGSKMASGTSKWEVFNQTFKPLPTGLRDVCERGGGKTARAREERLQGNSSLLGAAGLMHVVSQRL